MRMAIISHIIWSGGHFGTAAPTHAPGILGMQTKARRVTQCGNLKSALSFEMSDHNYCSWQLPHLPSAELRLLGGNGGSVGLPGPSGSPVFVRVGSRGGSGPKGACSAGVSRGLRVRAFSAIIVTPAGLWAARALESFTWGISSSELYDASSRQPVRSSLQCSLTLQAPLPAKPAFPTSDATI